MNFFEELKNFDQEVAAACDKELQRQRHNIELIASENIVSEAVLLAAGGVLTNKYAEGYPSKRYYGGCYCVDIVEEIARERVKKLFGCNFANVQPHSGANANLATFFAYDGKRYRQGHLHRTGCHPQHGLFSRYHPRLSELSVHHHQTHPHHDTGQEAGSGHRGRCTCEA